MTRHLNLAGCDIVHQAKTGTHCCMHSRVHDGKASKALMATQSTAKATASCNSRGMHGLHHPSHL